MDSQEIDSIPVMPSQPTNSRRRPRDEEPPVPRRRRRIPSNQSLAIVFEVELLSMVCQKVFARQFHNEDTEVHAWSEVEGLGHYRWLQGPMNHLPREQQLKFIADVMRQIFIFLRWY